MAKDPGERGNQNLSFVKVYVTPLSNKVVNNALENVLRLGEDVQRKRFRSRG